jgi:phosphate starvation-inducible protein PhoH and related proteins
MVNAIMRKNDNVISLSDFINNTKERGNMLNTSNAAELNDFFDDTENNVSNNLVRRSKKQRRREKKQNSIQKTQLTLKEIQPKTVNQRRAFDAFFDEETNLFLHGVAGTGKTFLNMYFACEELFDEKSNKNKILIVRSAVPTRDIGFLKGGHKEKISEYEQPYEKICVDLFDRGDSYDILKRRNQIEFTSTSYIRGQTWDDTIVVVDEVNNMTFHELDSIITRVGTNCTLLFGGDYRQSDLLKSNERQGLLNFIKIIQTLKQIKFIEFDENDIVRSGIVKDYIIAKQKLGYNTYT